MITEGDSRICHAMYYTKFDRDADIISDKICTNISQLFVSRNDSTVLVQVEQGHRLKRNIVF